MLKSANQNGSLKNDVKKLDPTSPNLDLGRWSIARFTTWAAAVAVFDEETRALLQPGFVKAISSGKVNPIKMPPTATWTLEDLP